MKILKEGKIPEPRPYRGTCKNCSTEVEFENNEAHTTGAIDDRGDLELFVSCPLCSRRIIGVKQPQEKS